MPYSNHVFTAFAFLGFLCCAIPFPWHLEAWNTGTCLYMAWTGLACLNQFINSIVWNNNAINWAPVWCDISSKFIVGTAVAIPAASLCINRRLYHIASVKSVTVTKAEKRRQIMVDLAIGLGLPIMEMVLQYIPQGHRFNIFEEVGCYPFTYNTPVAFALVSAPPIAIGIVSATYSIMSIRAFNKSRAQFNEFLSNSGHSNINNSRYIRLMCLSAAELFCTIPFGCYAIYLNAHNGAMRPWKGWADTHIYFSRVGQIPSVLWRANKRTEVSLELTRWLIVFCAFIFFAFFGFADEAKKNYRSGLSSVAKKVGINSETLFGSSGLTSSNGAKSNFNTSKTGSKGKVRPVLPVFVHTEMLRRHDSIDSSLSVSFQDAGGALSGTTIDEKEKGLFSPVVSYGELTLTDVGGMLGDLSSDELSSPPSSGSSSTSSRSSIVEQPDAPVMRDVPDIEISSVRGMSISERPISLAVPEAAYNGSPRHPFDGLSAV